MNLQNRRAIVTGAAQGIGFAMARRLHAEGARVALLDINDEKVRASAAQLAGCVDLAGARMIFSLAPKIVKMLPGDTPREERIQVPVQQDVLERLLTMPEFRKAYEEDGMTREQFITFGSTNRTTDQFINDGWNPLAAYRY